MVGTMDVNENEVIHISHSVYIYLHLPAESAFKYIIEGSLPHHRSTNHHVFGAELRELLPT